jgi:hypothetical protein
MRAAHDGQPFSEPLAEIEGCLSNKSHLQTASPSASRPPSKGCGFGFEIRPTPALLALAWNNSGAAMLSPRANALWSESGLVQRSAQTADERLPSPPKDRSECHPRTQPMLFSH